MDKRLLNIAHRGASGIAPENTISAFLKAVEAEADIIELDVQLSSDQQLLVIHNETIKKYTGIDKNVRDLDFNYLKELDFGEWFSPEFRGERIPLLQTVFEKIGKKIKYNIEIKKGEKFYPGITEKVLHLVNKYNLREHVLISSFDLKTINKLRELDEKITAGLIFNKNEWDYFLKVAKKLNCQFIVPEKSILTESYVNKAHTLGLLIFPYVADEEEEILSLIRMGVDGIITNRPDRLSRIINELNSV
jgi:glycerophosphoryl diester phosphodiesterase